MAQALLALFTNGSDFRIRAGTQGSPGTVLATIPMDATEGTESNGVITFTVPILDAGADASGTAGMFEARNGAGTVVLTGTVGTSAADMIVASVTITATQPVNVTSCAWTAPA